jgi:hypothetical protein
VAPGFGIKDMRRHKACRPKVAPGFGIKDMRRHKACRPKVAPGFGIKDMSETNDLNHVKGITMNVIGFRCVSVTEPHSVQN